MMNWMTDTLRESGRVSAYLFASERTCGASLRGRVCCFRAAWVAALAL